MRISRFGSLLLATGALVGVAAGVGLLLGFEPASLPPAMLNIAAYKLTFLGAFGLLAAGAVLIRYSRREESRDAAASLGEKPRAELTEGKAAPFAMGDSGKPPRERTLIERERQK
jgi:hypothetical protein